MTQQNPAEESSLAQWEKLYEVAIKIKELAPWDSLWDSDLITIMLPGHDEPTFISVMGRNGECYGIGVYPGYEAIDGLYRISKALDDESPFAALLTQSALMCYYGDREELMPEERQVIKSLNLRFRGKNNWIYFRSYSPGYYPWRLSDEEVQLMIDALQNFVMAFRAMTEKGTIVDFEHGETLFRMYSPEQELWLTSAAPMPPIPTIRRKLILDNEMLTQQLARKKKTGAQIDFDATFMPSPVQESKGKRPYFPRLLLVMDRREGLVLDQHIMDPAEDFGPALIDMLSGYVRKNGKPLAIHVRDTRIGAYIEDFCSKVGVKLVDDKGVPAIDAFLESLFEHMEGDEVDDEDEE